MHALKGRIIGVLANYPEDDYDTLAVRIISTLGIIEDTWFSDFPEPGVWLRQYYIPVEVFNPE